MGSSQGITNAEPAIWTRLIATPQGKIPPDAARYLLSMRFSETDHARMQDLMDKSNEGLLTDAEAAELDGYINVANVLTVIQSRARVALRDAGIDFVDDSGTS
jgi:hypothetical protein